MKKAIIFILVIVSITLIRIPPKYKLPEDEFAFWGCTGDFWTEVNPFSEEGHIPHIDPKYKVFSKAFYPVKFGYPPLWIVTIASFKSVFNLSNPIIGKLFIYLIGILGSFSIYYFTKELTNSSEMGLLSALILNLSPYYVVWTNITRFMVLAVPLIPLSLYFLVKSIKESNVKYILLSGIFGSGVLLTHHFSFWPLAATFVFSSLVLFIYLTFKRKFQKIGKSLLPLIVLFIAIIIGIGFYIEYPFFQNMLQSGWRENSLRSTEQYFRFISPFIIFLLPFGIITSLWKIKNNENRTSILVLFIWTITTFLGTESSRISDLIGSIIPLNNPLILNTFVPQTSSRLLVHLSQPMSIFAILGIFGIWKVIDSLEREKLLKIIAGFLICILISFSIYNSYSVSKKYTGKGVNNKKWEVIDFICEELPENASVLTHISVGEAMIQKCNKQFLAYYTYARDPNEVYRIRKNILTEKDPKRTWEIAKEYEITHILVNRNRYYVNMYGKDKKINSEKFKSEYFSNVYKREIFDIYKVKTQIGA
ncbi:MAG: ArnT family glycosyltransferase [Candidatus Aenigmatarchaeota archaeon]